MKIVKKIFYGGHLDEIQSAGKAFEHIQPNLSMIDIVINGDYFYWLVTIEDHSIISRA